MKRWLVTGAAGMLGTDVIDRLRSQGETVTALTRAELDITDPRAVERAVADHDVVVNTAAWTDVDGAEAHEADAYAINATGPAWLAQACASAGARLVQVSTDYVFDGTATRPYPEDASTAPRSAYGRTKLDGEVAVRATLPDTSYVVRTAWLYGAAGKSFVATMARLAHERDHVDVVDDQHGQPTWTVDVADQLVALVLADAPAGTYHATSSGDTTWFGLARAVFEELGHDPDRVRRTTSEAFVRPAPRPSYSVLGHEASRAIGIEPIRDWRDALRAAAPTVLGQYARSPE